MNGIKGSLASGTDATVNIRDWMGKVTLDILGLGKWDRNFSPQLTRLTSTSRFPI